MSPNLSLTLAVVLVGVFVFVALFSLLYSILRKTMKLGDRVLDQDTESPSLTQRLVKRVERVFIPLGQMVPRSPEELSKEALRLVRAGIRRKDAVILLYGAKVATIVGVMIVLSLLGMPWRNPLLFVALSILLGVMLPDICLRHCISKRKLRLQNALPDMMDLTVVSVEAGLGLDQSLQRVGREIRTRYRDLSEELHLYNLEVNAGKKRIQAFRNLSERTDVDDLRSLVAVLVQADRFGTSIASSLRIFSDSLRVKRRQRAEEHAAKMSIKMIVPLVVFVFPAIFIVVLGPAMIRIYRDFLPWLNGGG